MALRDIDVLGAAAQEGRAQAQVPHIHISFTPQQQQAADEYEDKIKDLIDRGMLGWVLFNPKPGLKNVYTHEPRNPNTNRTVDAWLSMTKLAVLIYAKELFDLYDNSPNKKQYPTGPANAKLKFLDFHEFMEKLLKEAIEAPPAFQNQVNLLAAKLVLSEPQGKQKVSYQQVDSTGHAIMISKHKLKR